MLAISSAYPSKKSKKIDCLSLSVMDRNMYLSVRHNNMPKKVTNICGFGCISLFERVPSAG
jgi:hypothetical protein